MSSTISATAVPTPTVDEVYAGVDEKKKEYSLWVESAVRQQFNADKPESLQGIRVLDMTANQIIGHWCSSHFSELGAEVIMVEPPGGDPNTFPGGGDRVVGQCH